MNLVLDKANILARKWISLTVIQQVFWKTLYETQTNITTRTAVYSQLTKSFNKDKVDKLQTIWTQIRLLP